MTKKIKSHEEFVLAEIQKFENILQKADSENIVKETKKDIENLNNYHQKTINDCQHERLIHLIVTFFFAGLLLKSIIVLFLLTFLPADFNSGLVNILVMIICGILFIVEIFYVRHYYLLENGTQRLYLLSKRLYDLINHKR